jgi:acyl-CoA reductase-like NAD-dependent aldehyde dehydrogenase
LTVAKSFASNQITLQHPDRLFIDGRWVEGSTSRRLTPINPATEEPIVAVAEASEADIDKAVAAARKAFDEGPWPRMTAAERAPYLLRLVAELRKRRSELAASFVEQVGAPVWIAEGQMELMYGIYERAAALADTFAWEEPRKSLFYPGDYGLLVREPVGVVAAISPWNAPLLTVANKVAPALIAGCTVILKPSPETPIDSYILAECAAAAGLPAGVLNMVPAERVVSEHLVKNPGVDKVSFTGSSAVGRRIATLCGERIARYTLELGGKSAAIVLDDFDIGEAAANLGFSLCILTGQNCANLSRVLVSERRHDQFVEAMAATLKALRIGNPYDKETVIGPLAMKRQLERVEGYVAIGKTDGAQLVAGGSRPADLERGYYFEPTIFGHVDNRSRIAREEIFGPVVSVITYRDIEEAIALANDSSFGLNGAVFTNDPEQAYRVSRRIRTGTMGQNGSRVDFSIAFGGFKQSGLGREGGPDAVLPYLESKTVVLRSAPAHLSAGQS